MAEYIFYREPIFQFYKEQIEFLIDKRNNPENRDKNISINMNLILDAACFVEGFMEKMAKCVLGYYKLLYREVNISKLEIRRPMNSFYARFEEELFQRISQTTGIDNFNKLFELLLGKSFKTEKSFKPVIEPIQILFQLRNVIAHAREISAYEVKAYWTNNLFEENFIGGYKKAEEFLLKNGIIKENFIETQNIKNFFNDSVADYFYQESQRFAELLQNFVEGNMEIGDVLLNQLNIFNEKYHVNLSFLDFCEENAYASGDFRKRR